MEEKENSQIKNNDIILKITNFSFVIDRTKKKTVFPSMDFKKGDFILLKGKNGSGKSTFLKYLNNNFYEGSYSSCDGKIEYFDENQRIETTGSDLNSDQMAYLRRRIVEIKQMDESESWISAYASIYDQTNYALQKMFSQEETEERRTHLIKLIQEFFEGYQLDNGDSLALRDVLGGISEKDFKRKKLKSYSGGQQKMVQIIAGFIKAIIIDSPLMIIDEPANNLDGKNKYYLNQLFKFLRKENKNLCIVMISHCHVFDDINVLISIESDKKTENQYVARILSRTAATEEEQKMFIPHSDCIDVCENLSKAFDHKN